MNNDLISRSALKEEFAKHEDRKGYLIGDWADIIDNAPPADIKPFASFTFDKDELDRIVEERVIEPIKNGELVVKNKWGKWIISEVRCPHCLKYFDTDCYSTEEMDKCPCCGADMRGGRQTIKI